MVKIAAFEAYKNVFSQPKNIIILVLCIILVIFVLSYELFGGSDIHDNGNGVNTITSELNATAGQLQSAGTAVTEGQRTADAIQSTNNEIAKSISTSQSINKSSRELLKRGQQILSGIQCRAEENSAAVKN